MKKKTILRLLLLVLLLGANVSALLAQKPKKNIVIIMADDFNYWNSTTKYYPEVKTPNLDKLSAKGVLFADAQAAAPVCNPSRQALWSGFRPSTSGIQGNSSPWIRLTTPFQNVVTMNQYFKQNGYYCYGWGKLYHSKFGETGKTNDDDNWSAFSTTPIGGSAGNENVYQASAANSEFSWSVNPNPMTTSNCRDFAVATETANLIRGYAASPNKDKPFFFACGLSKPHLGWDAPKQFHSMFTTANMVPPRGYVVGDLSDTSEGQMGEFTELIGAGKWKDAIHMYVSLLALADYNAGVIIDAVNGTAYKDNTIIVFMGDHGWHLGEKQRFGKASPWDMANKTTLIIYDPSYTNTTGTPKICKKVVSLQDVYPTLLELSGLPIKTDIEGNSLAALIENPDKPDWDKPVVVTRLFDRIRTNKYSYCDNDGNGGTTPTSSDMLYDIENDPDELTNMLHSSYTSKPRAEVLNIRTRLVFQLDSIKKIGLSMKKKLTDGYKFLPKQLAIPGTIEAEDYDEGGYEQTHYDSDQVNSGGQYRTADATDIYTTDDATGVFHLGGLSTGEWCNYTVKDYLSGNYNVAFRVKNRGTSPAVLQIYNRDLLLTEFTIPASTMTWQTINAPQIQLADQNSTRLKIKVKSGSGVEFNNMKFEMVISGVSVTGVSITACPTSAMNVNTTNQLTATVAPINATNKSVNWSSSNTAIATVTSTGLVTAIADGSATITVTTVDGAKTAVCELIVSTSIISVTGVTITGCSTSTMNVNTTNQLIPTVAPTNATNQSVNWSSSNTAIATVSSTGLVTATAVGSATITVTTVDGNKTAVCDVTVADSSIAVTSVSVSGCPTATMNVNATNQLTATVAPTNATNKSVTWSSTNTAVATVSSTGLVTATAVGSATITVITVDGAKTAVCNLTVAVSTPAQTPYGGVNRKIPGFIEGEHYDEGIEGFAYHDDATKQGVSTFRPGSMVDVVNKTAASGGKAVGYTLTGEWLEYKVDATPGTYDIRLSYFCNSSIAGDLKVSLNGTLLATITSIVAQSSLTVLAKTTVMRVNIAGGNNSALRLEVINGAKFDIDAIEFIPSSTTAKISSDKTAYSESVDNGFRIYPNPVSDILNLEFSDATSSKHIKVFNTNGQLVYSTKTTKGTASIDIKTLNLKGVVMVQVVEGGSVYNNKVIIK